jgi:DNA-binding SARP family transcriptional activator
MGCAYSRRFRDAEIELDTAVRASHADNVIPVYAAAVRAHFISWAQHGRPEALEALEQAIGVLEREPERDLLAFLPWMHLLRAYLLNDLGHHEEALGAAARAVAAADRRGLSRTPGRTVAWLRSVALAGLERWDELEAELAPPDRLPASHEATSYAYRYHAAAALLAASRGDAVGATAHIRLGREGMRLFGAVSDDPSFLCDFAVAAHRVEARDLATALAREAYAVARDIGAEWQRARTALVRAAVEATGSEADGFLAEALALSADPLFESLWAGRERRLAGPLLARALLGSMGPPGVAVRLLARCGGEVLARCAADLAQAPVPVRVQLAAAAAEAVAADGEVIDALLRDRDAVVRSAARRSWVALRKRPRAALRIASLGELRVWRDGVTVPGSAFGRQKARALLAFLLARDRAVHREELCEALWPGLSPERASAALRTTLHDLRRALHPEIDAGSESAAIVADGEAIRVSLTERDALDLAELESCAAAVRMDQHDIGIPRLEVAVALYRGPFLSEWPYEEWAESRRETAAEAHQTVLQALATALAECGRSAAAAERWRRLVALDPEHEGWHRGLMRAYAAADERALALRQFHACRAVLRRRQGIEPGPETRALYSAILREEPEASAGASVT